MASNRYDQAGRYLARQDPPGLLPWFFRSLPRSMGFLIWLDTRSTPFPGEVDGTGDTVACMQDTVEHGPLWAIPFEFQREPDPEMFGRYLQYLGSLWREQRPPNRPGEHYCVVGCLINFTGDPVSSRDYQLGDARAFLQLEECNIATKDADVELSAIVAGKASPWVLALIPLMQKGSDPGIINQWLTLAGAERNLRQRGDYGALALVFAELAGCAPVWKQALKEWNMQESQQVLEWQAEGEARGEVRGILRTRREDLRKLLEHRFGSLPEALRKRIEEMDNVERLQKAFDDSLALQRLDDLQL